MDPQVQTLTQYTGTDKLGAPTTIVAPDMETACVVYKQQKSEDPVIMQTAKTGIACVLPNVMVAFTTKIASATAGETDAAAIAAGCTCAPPAYTLFAGDKQVFTANAGEGWVFNTWKTEGGELEGVAANTAELTKALALLTLPISPTPLTIQAVFKKV